MAKVLVAYATKYGSTQEIAEVVGAALREDGLDADVKQAADVSSLEGYAGVVVGSALYNHKWHKDAQRFVDGHRAELERVPVAVFTVGPVNDTPEEFDAGRQQLADVLARWKWLNPVTTTVFGGRFDPQRFHFPGAKLLLSKAPASDIVDPEKVRAWAHTVPPALAVEAR